MDSSGTREPNFVIKGFDMNMKIVSFAEMLMYKKKGEVIQKKLKSTCYNISFRSSIY
jgi:hypothetical protein